MPPTTVVAMIGVERQGDGQAIIAVETQGENHLSCTSDDLLARALSYE